MSTVKDERTPFWLLIFTMWLVAVVATLGSLFFSEMMDFIPCSLCWYQRIFMYPLVIIFLVGMSDIKSAVVRYALPLTVLGWLVAGYHNLLHFGFISESATPCVYGVPCSTKYIQWFGFVTIPLLSFIAFSVILLLLIILKGKMKNEK